MVIGETRSPNFDKGRKRRRPSAVVVHTTDGSFGAAAAWMTDPASGVSAHYLVGLDGSVLQLVDERDTARHAGVLVEPAAKITATLGDDPNLKTIGIEFADDGNPGGINRPDAQYEVGAELLRAISDRWKIPLDREHVLGHRELRADKTCPGNFDIDRLILDAGAPFLLCLLPMRNEESNLPGWLESAPGFCEAVIALDDGSTDRTAEILEGHDLFARILRAPQREGYAGWDDATNRRLLLEAAAELRPRWIIQVDADERIDADDAQALRSFLEEEAIEGCAYGLRHYRQWGERVDPQHVWVYRIFRWRPGLTLPQDRRLHFNPVPVSIPRGAWIRTTIRLRHVGASDEAGVAARAAKYAAADPDREFEANTSGMDAAPTPDTQLAEWEPRDPEMPVLVTPSEQAISRGGRPDLVVLLPVRNGAGDLPRFFDAARRFADSVIALDDGSTDGTATLLRDEPLVATILSNPVRETWSGWDEPRDRSRLLEAAAELRPRFVLFLDADERIDADDGAALRGFVERDALPGFAYGMRVHRMVRPEPPGYDRADLWAYRLFAWEPDQVLPSQSLHLVPVPISIPRPNYMQTTIRIQHHASETSQRRRLRYEKYEELDPARRWQSGYEHLLDEPGQIRAWEPRLAGLPVVAEPDVDLTAPVLSVVVIARDDGERIDPVLRSVQEQETEEAFETIVVVSGSPQTAAVVRDRFPEVTLVDLERPVFPGAARNAGLRIARGDYVSFPGSHVVLSAGSLRARMKAHELGYPMVTGSIRNGTRTPSGWANYFLDHSTALPGRPAGELRSPPAHCSYDRDLLIAAGGFPEDLRAGEDTFVNNRMFGAGLKAYRSPEIELTHATRCDRPTALLAHHWNRGRALGRLLFDPAFVLPVERRGIGRMVASLVPRRVTATARAVAKWGGPQERRAYRESRLLIIAAAVASWCGTLFEAGMVKAAQVLEARR
ncbi:MAG: glycosyltransferase [Actinomycetota bacterium]